MSPRLKKLIGALAMMAFLVVYVWAAVAIADVLPDHPAVHFIYFVVVGLAWGLPLFPLLSWMNRDTRR